MSKFEEYYVDTLKNRYADFSGRARRSEYWYFVLFNALIVIAISILTPLFGRIGPLVGTGLMGIYVLATIVPSLAVVVRRLHDTGKSGWWYFIGIIPILGAIILLVFLCTDSQPGRNTWGSNPLEESDVSDFLISDEA